MLNNIIIKHLNQNNMENGKQGAFACVDSQKQYLQEGLTKREYFAAMAMQGILANPELTNLNINNLAILSINQADELLKELENK